MTQSGKVGFDSRSATVEVDALPGGHQHSAVLEIRGLILGIIIW